MKKKIVKLSFYYSPTPSSPNKNGGKCIYFWHWEYGWSSAPKLVDWMSLVPYTVLYTLNHVFLQNWGVTARIFQILWRLCFAAAKKMFFTQSNSVIRKTIFNNKIVVYLCKQRISSNVVLFLCLLPIHGDTRYELYVDGLECVLFPYKNYCISWQCAWKFCAVIACQ